MTNFGWCNPQVSFVDCRLIGNEPNGLRLSLGLMAFNLYSKSDNDKKCILNGISRVRIDREDGALRGL
jgi:hypothetical protein